MKDLNETRLTSDQLVDGKLLKVYRDRVRLPDGEEGEREWIDHPGASAVVPIFTDGNTLMVRQFRYPPGRVFLEVPAGKLDKEGENPEDVAVRELEEETGWTAERLVKLGALYPCIGYSNEIIHLFLAEGLRRGERNLSEGEFMEVVTLPFDEAVSQARTGELLDMKSAIALIYAHDYLYRRGERSSVG